MRLLKIAFSLVGFIFNLWWYAPLWYFHFGWWGDWHNFFPLFGG